LSLVLSAKPNHLLTWQKASNTIQPTLTVLCRTRWFSLQSSTSSSSISHPQILYHITNSNSRWQPQFHCTVYTYAVRSSET